MIYDEGTNISTLKVVVKPNSEENLKVSGRLFYVEDTNIPFKIETDGGSRADMAQGRKVRLATVTKNLRVVNNSATELRATFLYGFGDVTDGFVVGNVRVESASSMPSSYHHFFSDDTNNHVLENKSRASITLYAKPTNTRTVYIRGDGNGTGFPLTAGHSHEISNYTGWVYLTSGKSGTQNSPDDVIYVLETEY